MKERKLFTICLFLFCLGFVAVHFAGEHFLEELKPSQAEKHIPPDSQVHLEGEIYRTEEREDYQILYLKNNSIIYTYRSDNHSIKESKLFLYDSQKTEVKIGNKVRVSGRISSIEAARNPGNFDREFYYRKQNIHVSVWADHLQVTDPGFYFVRDHLQQFRDKWKTLFYEAAGERDGAVLVAMIAGDRAGMDEEVRELYQINGIAHILAISGLHLSFIGTGLYQFLRRQTGSYLAGGTAGIIFLSLYVMMIGATVSVIRALTMFLIRVGADMTGRAYDMLTSLSVAAVLAVLWQPLSYYDGAFQMSFGAVLGIWIAERIQKEWKKRGGKAAGKWKSSLVSSLGVQAVLFPVTLYHFFSYPLYSVLLNLFVIPLMSLLLMLGVGGSLVYCFFPPGGKLLFWGCRWILDLYELSCRTAMRLPASEVTAGQPELGTVVYYYGALAAAMWIFFKKGSTENKKTAVCAASAFAVLLLAGQVSVYGQTQITMLDVGQGDCIFLRGPSGTSILVDGGSSTEKQIGKYRIEPYLESQGVRRLDYVFVTHGDEDHINGIEEMLDRQDRGIRIASLIFPAREVWDDKLMDLAEKAQKCGVDIRVIGTGQGISSREWEITCVQPAAEDGLKAGNEASLVLSVSQGDFDLLLTGDAEGAGEERLLERLDRTYDVLKAAHHGSRNSSSAAFLEKIAPRCTLISAGQGNSYGHPHPDAIRRIEAQGSAVYTTLQGGAVTVRTDGRKMETEYFLRE